MPDDPGAKASAPLYRGMDKAALDAAYNNAAAVAGSAEIVAGWRQRSDLLRASPEVRTDVPYAPAERAKLDFFPAKAEKAPLFLFIHGGYWQMREKESFSIFADGPRARGINVAMAGYTLAPQARLGQIVEEIRHAVSFLATNADDFGFDRDRLYVGGWSAGGHLTAAMLDHPLVRGGLAISGIYDLEPISLCYVNDALKLDAREIADLSPLRHVQAGLAPVRVIAGGAELPELRRQSQGYAAAASTAGMAVSSRLLPGHNHFSILNELAEPAGALTEELVSLIS